MIDGRAIYALLSTPARKKFAETLEAWADCDAVEPEITDELAAIGLMQSVTATKDDAAQPFASEGNIVAGEPMWKLTASGKALAEYLRRTHGTRLQKEQA